MALQFEVSYDTLADIRHVLVQAKTVFVTLPAQD